MPVIDWTAPALRDLRAIDDWLTRNASAETAVRLLGAIRERATFLERFPLGGRAHDDGLRVLIVPGTPYLIRYRVAGDIVTVLRVRHERQNWQTP